MKAKIYQVTFAPRTEQRIIRRARARKQSIEKTITQLLRDGLNAQTRGAGND